MTAETKQGSSYFTPLAAPVEDYHGLRATRVERWYNRTERSWVVMLVTDEGYQVGASTYVYSREDALDEVKWMVANPLAVAKPGYELR